ncbi:MAG TPA: hypothetical protein VHH36_01185 [Candidatus Thermoplasmatota archaeon]|nr:hypothetical protein [Candidatus Thermoplasmatota archaeon]
MKTLATLLAAALVATALAGCANNTTTTTPTGNTTGTPTTGGTPTPTTPGANGSLVREVTFVAMQSAAPGPNATNITYSFTGPDAASAGWLTIHLQNKAPEPHQAVLYKVPQGLTFAQFQASLMEQPHEGEEENETHDDDHGPEPAGGVGFATPGGNATAVVRVEPGKYAVVCFIPGPSGMPHAMAGMMRELNVTAAPANQPPTANVTLTMKDFEFNLSKNLTAGRHVVEVHNLGPSHHEAPLIHLAPNATAMDFIAYFDPSNTPTGPPPVVGGAGVGSIPTGAKQYMVLDLVPGRYAFVCFESSGEDAPPHFALGMVHEFDVA